MTPETFARKLSNLEGMWRRLDNGQAGGRNAASSDATRAMRTRELAAAVSADAQTEDAPLCAFLDANPKVAARWDRCERRNVGLPV